MKHVIYKALGGYKVTTEENYNSGIQNARKIHDMKGFESVEEIIEYLVKWCKYDRESFIVVE